MDNGSKSGGAAGGKSTAADSVKAGFQKPGGIAGVPGAAIGALTQKENAATEAFGGGGGEGEQSATTDAQNLETADSAEGVNYTGGGREEEEEDGKGNFFAGKKGPIATIIGVFLALAGLVGGSQLLQPFSLLEQLRTSFNSMQTSVSYRSNVIFKYQLGKDVKNPTKSKLFGGKVFKVSNKQKNKLEQNGIKMEEMEVDGKTKTVMRFDDGSGTPKIIVADSNDVGKLRIDGAEVMDFNAAFKTNSAFFEAYKAGSMTWRGAIANWFETATMNFLANNKLTRNLFDNFRQKVEEDGGNVKATAVDLMAKGTEEVTELGGTKKMSSGEDDGKGNKNLKTEQEEVPSKKLSTDFDEAKVKNVLDENVGQKVKGDSGGGVSGVAQTALSTVCMVSDTIGAISLLVTGVEALQIIHLVTAYMETIDKVKAGDGEDSPINELSTTLNQRVQNDHTDFDFDTENFVNNTIGEGAATDDSIKNMQANAANLESTKTTSTDKTAMESSGITALYSGGKVNPNDASVKSFNFSGSIKRIVFGLGVSMASFNVCSVGKIIANAAGVIEGAGKTVLCVIGLIGAIFSYGTTSTLCAGYVEQIIEAAIKAGLIAAAISAVISALVPFVSGMLTRNLIKNLGGEDLGNALVSGANMYMGNVHRYNGGSLSNTSSFTQFALAQQEVIAEDAKYERMTKSPFDVSSQYTFLGTLARQLMNFAGTSSVMSAITSTSDVLSSSIASLSPTAAAAEVSNKLVDNYDEVCPYLDSIGAVGDAYCNPYAVTDLNTISMDPGEVLNEVADNLIIVEEDNNGISGCVEGSDDPTEACPENMIKQSDEDKKDNGIKINPNSDLAKYILYCNERTSAFGIMDLNIANELSSFGQIPLSGTAGSAINGAIGSIPTVGDIIDVVDNVQKLENYGYIFGQSCVAGNDVPDSMELSDGGSFNKTIDIKSPGWSKAQYYQRFIEDQSLMESMGIIDKSAVTAFIEEYREEHPLDNSYAGVLARYSGLTKDNVIALLDTIDYVTYIAEYDPTTRYAFGQEFRPAGAGELKFDNDNKVAYIILLNDIEFADVRNRNFVV